MAYSALWSSFLGANADMHEDEPERDDPVAADDQVAAIEIGSNRSLETAWIRHVFPFDKLSVTQFCAFRVNS
jgi:hypothetical protein